MLTGPISMTQLKAHWASFTLEGGPSGFEKELSMPGTHLIIQSPRCNKDGCEDKFSRFNFLNQIYPKIKDRYNMPIFIQSKREKDLRCKNTYTA